MAWCSQGSRIAARMSSGHRRDTLLLVPFNLSCHSKSTSSRASLVKSFEMPALRDQAQITSVRASSRGRTWETKKPVLSDSWAAAETGDVRRRSSPSASKKLRSSTLKVRGDKEQQAAASLGGVRCLKQSSVCRKCKHGRWYALPSLQTSWPSLGPFPCPTMPCTQPKHW